MLNVINRLLLLAVFWASMSVSGYSVDGDVTGCTASGVTPVEGVTIASHDLPFGARVYIGGHCYTVQERMEYPEPGYLDVYFDSYEDAASYGRQEIMVRVEID